MNLWPVREKKRLFRNVMTCRLLTVIEKVMACLPHVTTEKTPNAGESIDDGAGQVKAKRKSVAGGLRIKRKKKSG